MYNIIEFKNKSYTETQKNQKLKQEFDLHMEIRHNLMDEYDAEQRRIQIIHENGKLKPEDIHKTMNLMEQISKESNIISRIMRQMEVTPPEDEVNLTDIMKETRQNVYGLHVM